MPQQAVDQPGPPMHCRDCLLYEETDEFAQTHTGRCHRRPKVFISKQEGWNYPPVTGNVDWCHEFTPRKL